MDKRIILAVAGSGKTTHIINSLSQDKRSLLVTYTKGNYQNLKKKIIEKFNDKWPNNITLMTYFTFLYTFCYKPFYSDKNKTKGIRYDSNPNNYLKQTNPLYYWSSSRHIYSNRLALFLEKAGVIEDLKTRLEKYFDEFIIDEVQDIAGRDFNFLQLLMDANMDMLFVGDFYQHTYDTSRDGNVNSNLFEDKAFYEKKFIGKGFVCDNQLLSKSWRCSPNICNFITEELNIKISSHYAEEESPYKIQLISDLQQIETFLNDNNIIKLHYQNATKYGYKHKNWAETKGEDKYQDVCVMLNKNTATLYDKRKLQDLPSKTKNKLYVAITRAHNNVYLIKE